MTQSHIQSVMPRLLVAIAVAAFPLLVHAQPPKICKGDAAELSAKFRQAAKSIQQSLVLIDAKCERADCAQKALAEHSSDREGKSDQTEQAGKTDLRPEALCKGGYSATGIVIDKKGYILTCNHVIGHAQSVVITLPNGRQFSAREVRSDPLSDLAVLYVPEAVDLVPAKLGNSALLDVGDFVVSAGHPYGLSDSISAGIVSALNREIEEVPRAPLIQSDAASNPGSSGGALLNLDGDIVGICEGGFGRTSGFAGISFAVPSNVAQYVTEQLIRNGTVRRAYLGCRFEPVTAEIAAAIGKRDVAGVIVTSIADESPASDKIKPSDVVLAFDGEQIAEVSALVQLIETADIAKSHELLLYREGKTVLIKIQLKQLPTTSPRTLENRNYKIADATIVDEEMGVEVALLPSAQLENFGYPPNSTGLFVCRVLPNRPTSKAGISAGMLILSIDRKAVGALDDYKSSMKSLQERTSFLMLIGSPVGNRHVVMKR